MSELDDAVARFKCRNKAAEPDGISSRIVQAVHRCDLSLLLDVYNLYLRTGTSPCVGKSLMGASAENLASQKGHLHRTTP